MLYNQTEYTTCHSADDMFAGNLEDITLRAIRVLQQASTVLAEDTRHTRKLLVHYGIRTQLLSLHEHNEHSRIGQVLSPSARRLDDSVSGAALGAG
jgi:16S rRNA C1402 (ribose-2'-O) methylase RsmI